MSKVSTIIRQQILSQYQESDVLIDFFEALASEGDVFSDAADDTNSGRTLERALGVNLDILGLLVGQGREVVDTNVQVFFGFSPDPLALSFTDLNDLSIGGRYRSADEPEITTRQLSDSEYRLVISAAIQRNISHCTGDEIIEAVKFVLGLVGISAVPRIRLIDGDTYYYVYIGRFLNDQEEAFLSGLNLLPKPAGVRVVYVEYAAGDYFGFAADPTAKGFGGFVEPPVARDPYETIIILDSPTLYLPLNDSAGSLVAINEISVDGVMQGSYAFEATSLLDSGEGSALDLRGVAGGIDVSAANPVVAGAFSLELWIKTQTESQILGSQMFRVLPNDVLGALMVDGTDGLYLDGRVLMWRQGVDTLNTIDLLSDSIYHVVFTSDANGDGRFWLNGQSGEPVPNVLPVIIDHIGFTGILANAYDVEVVTDTPLFYWRLGDAPGSLVAVDEMGNLDGEATAQTGFGEPGALVGSSDTAASAFVDAARINVSDPTLNVGGDTSLEFWVNINPFTTGHHIMTAKMDGNNSDFDVRMVGATGIIQLSGEVTNQANSMLSLTPFSPGIWNHIVCVFEGGVGKIYINGLLDNSGPLSRGAFNTPMGVLTHPVDFSGIRHDAVKGIMDEFAYYNYALSAERIAIHYLAGSQESSAFNGVIDQAVIYNYDLSPSQIIEHYSAGIPASAYEQLIVNDTPVAYLRLSDGFGTVAVNVIDEANPGAYVGTVLQAVDGLINNDLDRALELTGLVSSGVDLTTPVTLGATYSLECWISATNVTGVNLVIENQQVLFANAAGTIGLTINNSRLTYYDGTSHESAVELVSGTVFHCAFTFDNGAGLLYINGLEVASFTALTMGDVAHFGYDGATGGAYIGVLDEPAVYDYVLTPAQILNHVEVGEDITDYRSRILASGPIVYYRLGENLNATELIDEVQGINALLNSPSVTNFSEPGALTNDSNQAIKFNNQSAYATVQNPAIDVLDVSVECWVKFSSILTNNTIQAITVKREGSNNSTLNYWLDLFNGHIRWLTNNAVGITSPTLLEVDTWYHIVGTRGGTTLRLFINGLLDTLFVTGVTSFASTTNLVISHIGDSSSSSVRATVDELAIYNFRLTGIAVSEHYNAGRQLTTYRNAVINDLPLLYYQFSELSGTTTLDTILGFPASWANEPEVAHNQPGLIIDSTDPAFGFFDGDNANTAVPTTPLTPTFTIGAGDMTLEISMIRNIGSTSVFGLDGFATGVAFYFSDVGGAETMYLWIANSFLTVPLGTHRAHKGLPVHIMITRKSGLVRIFVNLKEVHQTSLPNPIQPVTNGVIIGNMWDGTEKRKFNGVLDDFAIYDYAVDVARIQDHFLLGNGGKYYTSVIGDNCLSLWRMNETQQGDFSLDALASENDLTHINAPVLGAQGLIVEGGSAVYYNGVDQWSHSNGSAFPGAGTNYSLECWFGRTSFATSEEFLMYGGADVSDDNAVYISIDATGINFTNWGAASTQHYAFDYTIAPVHVCITYDDLIMTRKAYVNGVLVLTLVRDTNLSGGLLDIGSRGDQALGFFNGIIDQPAVYIITMRDLQVLDHHEAGVGGSVVYPTTPYLDLVVSASPVLLYALNETPGGDNTPMVDLIGAQNGTFLNPSGLMQWGRSPLAALSLSPSVRMDGTQPDGGPKNIGEIGDAAAFAGDLTIEFLMERHTAAGSGNVLIQRNQTNVSDNSTLNYSLAVLVSTKKLLWAMVNSQGIISSTSIELNDTYHIAVTRTGTALAIYINGVVDATGNASSVRSDTTGYTTGIGGNVKGGQDALSLMSHVAFYDRVLPPSEILDHADQALRGV